MTLMCSTMKSVKPPHPPKGCSWLITLFNSHPWQAVYEPVAHFWLCSQVGRFGGGSSLTFFPDSSFSSSLHFSLSLSLFPATLCLSATVLSASLLHRITFYRPSPSLLRVHCSFQKVIAFLLPCPLPYPPLHPPSTFPLSRCSSPPPPSSSHIHASFYSSLLSLSLYFIYFFLF